MIDILVKVLLTEGLPDEDVSNWQDSTSVHFGDI